MYFLWFQWQSWVERYREFIDPNYLDDNKSAADAGINHTKPISPHSISTETQSTGSSSENWSVLWDCHIQEQ